MKKRYWVGIKKGNRTVFGYSEIPTEETLGNLFTLVIGPFRTLRGARFMATSGANNPHCLTVSDAERLASPS